jgi:hypothetical protein
MACPTCDHTIGRIAGEVFWCPRCGTLKVGNTATLTPQLVWRCREFASTLGPSWKNLWHRLGIEEAVNTPNERKEPL